MVLTNTSKLNIVGFFFVPPEAVCSELNLAGDALSPSAWPDGLGIPTLLVR